MNKDFVSSLPDSLTFRVNSYKLQPVQCCLCSEGVAGHRPRSSPAVMVSMDMTSTVDAPDTRLQFERFRQFKKGK